MFTADIIAATISKLADEFPDRLNPRDENDDCMYNGADGTHCIAGQVFVELGLDPQQLCEGAVIASAMPPHVENDFDEGAMHLLTKAQYAADGFTVGGSYRTIPAGRTWGAVADILTFIGLI